MADDPEGQKRPVDHDSQDLPSDPARTDAGMRCSACGYNLTGIDLGTCPECGGRGTAVQVQKRVPRLGIITTCTVTGFVVAALAGLFSVAAAGMGHGDYRPMALFFPYSMLVASIGDELIAPVIGLAVLQYPAYGLTIGLSAATSRRKGVRMAGCIGMCHFAAAVAVMMRLQ